jgi:acyl-CoA reductase-like NAD-dependent aldehyde dehydrogenase
MVEKKELLPKRVVGYIHEMGVRSLDHLAENAGEDSSAAMKGLIGQWKVMSAEEKEAFIDRVAASVVEVVAASAALPVGLKLGKKVAKATGKVIRKQTKLIRKAAKKADKPGKADKPKKDKPRKADKPRKTDKPKKADKP